MPEQIKREKEVFFTLSFLVIAMLIVGYFIFNGYMNMSASVTYPLTVYQVPAGGRVVSSPSGINCGTIGTKKYTLCSAQFLFGTKVTLKPYFASGYRLQSWSGCNDSIGNNCYVTIGAEDITVQPSFEKFFLVRVKKTGMGTIISSSNGINCGTDCSENFIDGDSITFTAIPDEGYGFTGWLGACSGSEDCALTIDGQKSITAVFNQI